MKTFDVFPFLRAWFFNPLRVGAVAPSGSALARLITKEIDGQTAPVVELGPGTGVFTRALLSQGLRQSDLTLIEYDSGFVDMLQHRYPDARVLHADAARLARIKLFEGTPVGAVVSGLPLLSMPTRTVMAILLGSFSIVRAGGAFYQFTYGARCPVRRVILDRLGLKAVRIGGALLNLPPASVYMITRRTPGTDLAISWPPER